ncbi:class I SAM-dependent methyltransferase [Rhodococcus spongiicola]|uniref:Methyltransferase domain-containing protein n=1 Tax=Rhodococcus spongiicola TaxID=2487352 RepID=A0A438AUS0_9NOCA|nr:methyltransferase domain-containing protein [Rhodococcus spongiicola]RVW02480.1 methyltransferase domain-containing protein [Rhodococcus spongiicola]
MKRTARYRTSALFYDLISAEWPVYRAGRVAAIDLLELQPGEHVLDVGCGTGLNFSHLQRRIGPDGSITGIDTSAHMLAQARRRTHSAGWDNVRLIEADGTDLDPANLRAGRRFDAAISTYVLSLMPAWPRAIATMIELTRPGGRVAVVDMQRPVGRAAAWTPLARLACLLGGSDIEAHPWKMIDSVLSDVHVASARGGHIQIRVGSVGGTSGCGTDPSNGMGHPDA